MKRLILALLLSFFGSISHAQSSSAWVLTAIFDQDKQIVGYIYHAYSIGSRNTKPESKVITGMRFICSKKAPQLPILAIFWDGFKESERTDKILMKVSVDKKELVEIPYWVQYGNLTFTPVDGVKPMIEAMKEGKTISFDWVDSENLRRRTAFSLTGFPKSIETFHTACQP